MAGYMGFGMQSWLYKKSQGNLLLREVNFLRIRHFQNIQESLQ